MAGAISLLATSVPAFVTMIYRLVFYVESPRFLISNGRFLHARKILEKRHVGIENDYLPKQREFSELVDVETLQTRHVCSQTLSDFPHIFKQPYLCTTLTLLVINSTKAGPFWGLNLFLPSLLADITSNSYFIAFIGYLGQIPGIMLMLIIVE